MGQRCRERSAQAGVRSPSASSSDPATSTDATEVFRRRAVRICPKGVVTTTAMRKNPSSVSRRNRSNAGSSAGCTRIGARRMSTSMHSRGRESSGTARRSSPTQASSSRTVSNGDSVRASTTSPWGCSSRTDRCALWTSSAPPFSSVTLIFLACISVARKSHRDEWRSCAQNGRHGPRLIASSARAGGWGRKASIEQPQLR
jgi:hypothetical protein